MKKNLNTFLLPYVFIFFGILAFQYQTISQSIYISEYYNTGTDFDGWTELIVAQDNVNLVGYILRDSDKNLATWKGGIRFRDTPMWRNVRAGTVIVIRHRGWTIIDDKKTSGYIEIGSDHLAYFDKVFYDCNIGNWQSCAMVIDEEDILQVINSDGVHIHAVANIESANTGLFATLPEPKLGHTKTVASNHSIMVVPGRDANGYRNELGRTKTDRNTGQSSKGFPNNTSSGSMNSVDENQLFWRQLRQPSWTSPSATATYEAGKVNLRWNAMTDPNPSDNVQGYLVVRINEALIDNAGTPADGVVYQLGNNIGSAQVVSNITSSQTLTYEDSHTINCGSSFIYRIYAYRFNASSDADADRRPENARGRSYNEINFAQTRIANEAPEKPVLSLNGTISLCIGEDIELTASQLNMVNNRVEWLRDNQVIASNIDKITINQAGVYKVRITNFGNCQTESEVVNIAINPPPRAIAEYNNQRILENQTLFVCSGDSLLLQGKGGDNFAWLVNGVVESRNSDFYIKKEGVVRLVVYNSATCNDTSYSFNIEFKQVSIELSERLMRFFVPGNQTMQEQSFTIRNTSEHSITVIIASPANFTVVSPAMPLILTPNQIQEVVLRYLPPRPEIVTRSLTINFDCKSQEFITLEAERAVPNEDVVLFPQDLDFGEIAICKNASADATIMFGNYSDFPVNITSFTLDAPFQIFPSPVGITLQPNEEQTFAVSVATTQAGDFDSDLVFSYEMNGQSKTISANLSASIFKTDFSISPNNVSFGEIVGCENTAISQIEISNQSDKQMTIIPQNQPANIRFIDNDLQLNPNESKSFTIEMTATENGNINGNFELISDLCDIPKAVQFEGSKNGVEINIEDSKLDFGLVKLCDEAYSNLSVPISINGLARGEELIIEAANFNNPAFSTSLKPGDNIATIAEFDVAFLTNVDGYYQSELLLTFVNCNIQQRITFEAQTNIPEIEMSDIYLNFGDIEVSEVSSLGLSITNKSKENFVLAGVNQLTPPFQIANPAIFPLEIAAGETEAIELIFIPQKAGLFENDISLSVEGLCINDVSIKLQGNALLPPVDNLVRVYIPEIEPQVPNSDFILPLHIDYEQGDGLIISEMLVKIRYGSVIFFPNINQLIFQERLRNCVENIPGFLECTFNNLFDNNRKEYTFELPFSILHAQSGIFQILVEVPSYEANSAVEIKTDYGICEINGECTNSDFYISIERPLSITSNFDILNTNVKLNVYVPGDYQDTRLEIYDALGNIVLAADSYIKSNGDNDISLNFANYSTGVYFAHLEWQGLRKIVKFMVF